MVREGAGGWGGQAMGAGLPHLSSLQRSTFPGLGYLPLQPPKHLGGWLSRDRSLSTEMRLPLGWGMGAGYPGTPCPVLSCVLFSHLFRCFQLAHACPVPRAGAPALPMPRPRRAKPVTGLEMDPGRGAGGGVGCVCPCRPLLALLYVCATPPLPGPRLKGDPAKINHWQRPATPGR